MFPTLLHFHGNSFLPEIQIPTFFFMTMLGGLLATFYCYFKAPKFGFSQVAVLDIGMVGIFFGVVGGRLFHVFFERWDFYVVDLTRIFEIWRGGFVSYGAFILGGLSVMLYIKLRKLPFLKYLDFMALSLPICVFFVRVGCLGAGCCYGKPTDFFIHLIFPKMFVAEGQADYSGLPLHATQIYEMMYAIGIFVFNRWYYTRKNFDGQIVLFFFMIYAFCRFFLEILRGDADRGLYYDGFISTGQIVSLGVFAVSSILYFMLWRRARFLRDKTVF